MNIEEFLQYIKENSCRITEKKQQELFTAVSKYGYQDANTYQAINSCCPLKFRQKMKMLIKVIPLQKKDVDLKIFLEGFLIKFIDKKYVRPIDFIDLLNSIRFRRKEQVQQIAQKYGMRQEYLNNLQELFENVEKMQSQLNYLSDKQKKWSQFQDYVLEFADPKDFLSVFLQGEIIKSSQQLRLLGDKYKIYIIEKTEFKLFEIINNLGAKHFLAQEANKSSTYPAFYSYLQQLSQKILQKKPVLNMKEVIDKIIDKLLNELMVSFSDSFSLIRHFYRHQEQQLSKLTEQYGLQGYIQQIKSNLLALISHISKEFQIYQIKIILQQSKKLLRSMKQKMGTPQIDFKQELRTLKDSLEKEFKIQKVDCRRLILSYYKDNLKQFNQIAQKYGLYHKQELILIIKKQFNKIIPNSTSSILNFKDKVQKFLEKEQEKSAVGMQIKQIENKQKDMKQEANEESSSVEPKQSTIVQQYFKQYQYFDRNKVDRQIKEINFNRLSQSEIYHDKIKEPKCNRQKRSVKDIENKKDQNSRLTKSQINQQLNLENTDRQCFIDRLQTEQLKNNKPQLNKQQMINPFQLLNNSIVSSNEELIKVLLVCYSSNQVKSINIKSIEPKGKSTISFGVNLQRFQFMRIKYTISFLYINKSKKFKLKIINSTFWNQKTSYYLLDIKQVYHGCSLKIIKDKQIKNESNLCLVHNHATFRAIDSFLTSFKDNYEDQIFIWMKILYDNYRRNINDEQSISKILQINKRYSIQSSKYFIYFLYSIYREKSFHYYEIFRLGDYLAFPKNYEKYVWKDYPLLEQADIFYRQLHLFNTLASTEIISFQLIKGTIQNIGFTHQKHIMKLLIKIASSFPIKISKVDMHLRRLFSQNNTLCAHDYYNLKIVYLKHLMEGDKSSQQKILLQFIYDLTMLYQQKCSRKCNKKIQIKHEVIQNIISQPKNFFRNKNVIRVTNDKALILLYCRCKTLYKLTSKQFNLMQVINVFINMKIEALTKEHATQAFLSAITSPYMELDQKIVKTICSNNGLNVNRIKQIIQFVIQDNQLKYDTNAFLSIVQEYFVRNQVQLYLLLPAIDQYFCKYQQDQAKDNFLKIFSKLIILKMSFIEGKIQNYLEAYFEMGNQYLRNIFINRIFSELRITYEGRQYQIVDLIYKAFPAQIQDNQIKREYFVNLYLQNI